MHTDKLTTGNERQEYFFSSSFSLPILNALCSRQNAFLLFLSLTLSLSHYNNDDRPLYHSYQLRRQILPSFVSLTMILSNSYRTHWDPVKRSSFVKIGVQSINTLRKPVLTFSVKIELNTHEPREARRWCSIVKHRNKPLTCRFCSLSPIKCARTRIDDENFQCLEDPISSKMYWLEAHLAQEVNWIHIQRRRRVTSSNSSDRSFSSPMNQIIQRSISDYMRVNLSRKKTK